MGERSAIAPLPIHETCTGDNGDATRGYQLARARLRKDLI